MRDSPEDGQALGLPALRIRPRKKSQRDFRLLSREIFVSEENARVTLGDAINDAVSAWCVGNGGGFPIAFVCALDFIDTDGKPNIIVSTMDEQPTHRSMGLSTYLDAWYRDDAVNLWAENVWLASEDDD